MLDRAAIGVHVTAPIATLIAGISAAYRVPATETTGRRAIAVRHVVMLDPILVIVFVAVFSIVAFLHGLDDGLVVAGLPAALLRFGQVMDHVDHHVHALDVLDGAAFDVKVVHLPADLAHEGVLHVADAVEILSHMRHGSLLMRSCER